MKRILSIAVAALACDAPSFAPVLADEGDHGGLLRQARDDGGVARDAAKALGLYKKVVEIGGATDAARDAELRVADLLEAKGDRGGALDALRALTDRFASRLDDDAKRRVHEAMVRLLPP